MALDNRIGNRIYNRMNKIKIVIIHTSFSNSVF